MKTLLFLAAGVAAGWYLKTKACACSHATTPQQAAAAPNAPTTMEGGGAMLATRGAATTFTDTTSSSAKTGITLGVDGTRSGGCVTGKCGSTSFSLATRASSGLA